MTTDITSRIGIRGTGGAMGILALMASCLMAEAQPLRLPGSGQGAPAGTIQAPPAAAPRSAPTTIPSAPPPSATMGAVRAIPETAILGKELLLNGREGRASMERIAGGYGLKFEARGFQIDDLLEPCGVSFGDEAVPLEALGRPAGVPRFKVQSTVCPIVFDVLTDSMLVIEPTEPCHVEAAQCRIAPRGLWGPEGRSLAAQARAIEQERSRAEALVRQGYRVLTERAGRDGRREVTREQAGFSSERSQVCRDYAREGTHGFCAARVTEARAASLAARVAATAPTRPAPRPAAQQRRPQQRPAPPVPLQP